MRSRRTRRKRARRSLRSSSPFDPLKILCVSPRDGHSIAHPSDLRGRSEALRRCSTPLLRWSDELRWRSGTLRRRPAEERRGSDGRGWRTSGSQQQPEADGGQRQQDDEHVQRIVTVHARHREVHHVPQGPSERDASGPQPRFQYKSTRCNKTITDADLERVRLLSSRRANGDRREQTTVHLIAPAVALIETRDVRLL